MELGQDEVLTAQVFLLYTPLPTRENVDQRAGCIANTYLNSSRSLPYLSYLTLDLFVENCPASLV